MKEVSINSPQSPRVILISGSRGLAESLIAELSEAGHQISVLLRRPAAADSTDSVVRKFPALHPFVGDLTDPDIGARWTEAALKRFGRIDCLINNAAIQGPGGRFHELRWQEIETTLDTCFTGPARIIHTLLKQFAIHGHGTVINLSGGGATAARPHFAPYGVAKCALVRLTETLALEYPALRFFAVAPGTLKTQMTESILKMGPLVAGKEYQPLKEKLDRGGDGFDRAVRLIRWLAEKSPQSLSGKLISAIWDDYEALAESQPPDDYWTLRRVDQVLIERFEKNGNK